MSSSAPFTQDVARLLAGAALMLSLLLFYQRRPGGLMRIYTAQAWIVAAAAFLQGWTHGARGMVAAGLLGVAVLGVAIPVALRLTMRRLAIPQLVAATIFPSAVQALLLVAMAYLAVMQTGVETLAGSNPATALAMVLLGLLLIISRQQTITQMIGFLSLQNGLMLAAIGTAAVPMALILSAASLLMVAAGLAGLYLFGSGRDPLPAGIHDHHPGRPG